MEREELILGINADIADATSNLETLQAQLDDLSENWDLPGLQVELEADVENAAQVVEDLKGELGEAFTMPLEVTGTEDAIAGLGAVQEGAEKVEFPLLRLGGQGGLVDKLGSKLGVAGLSMVGVSAAINLIKKAVDLVTKAWEAYNAKTERTIELTDKAADSFAETSGALSAIGDEMASSGIADGFDAITKAVADSNPEEFKESIIALGNLGLAYTDLGSRMAAIEGDSRGAMEQLALDAGIPAEWADNVARAVDSTEGFGAARQVLAQDGMSQELINQYEDQIRAIEQLNDSQQNLDVNDFASQQVELARGADLATQALLTQAETDVGPDASDFDTFNRFIELQKEAADTALWQDYANTLASVDFGAAALEGATVAMSAYTAALFAGVDAQVAEGEAYDNFADAITDANGEMVLAFDTTTQAGRDQIAALKGIAAVVDTELAEAYDNASGSQELFVAAAGEVRDALVNDLQNELDLTAEQANAVADALGLTEGDYEARFKLAGEEEARIKLGLLQSSIDNLPDDVQTTVTQAILVGDYTGAIAEVQDYYTANPPTTELTVVDSGFVDEIGAIIDGIGPVELPTHPLGFPEPDVAALADEAGPVEIETEADTSGAEDDIGDVVDDDHLATIDADADTTAAAAELLNEASRYRVATIYALADFIAAKTVLDGLTDSRTAEIQAVAYTGQAERKLETAARDRTSTIFVRTVNLGGGGNSYAVQRGVAGANASNARFGRT